MKPREVQEVTLSQLEAMARERLVRWGLPATEAQQRTACRSLLAHAAIRLDRHGYVQAQAEGLIPHDRLKGPRLSPADERALCLMLRDLERSGLQWHEGEGRFVEGRVPTALDAVRSGERFGDPPHPAAIRAAHGALGVPVGSVPPRPGKPSADTLLEQERELDHQARRDMEAAAFD